MKSKLKQYATLFLSTFQLSAFTFGGGFVIIPLIRKKFVEQLGWIGEEEMLDLVSIAQSSPGAIAVNGAIVVGYKLAGVTGLLTAVLGTVLPPFLILSVISVCYEAFRSMTLIALMLEGMQAGVGAVIASVVWDMGSGITKEKDMVSILVMIAAFAVSMIFNINVIFIILAAGILGFVRTMLRRRRGQV